MKTLRRLSVMVPLCGCGLTNSDSRTQDLVIVSSDFRTADVLYEYNGKVIRKNCAVADARARHRACTGTELGRMPLWDYESVLRRNLALTGMKNVSFTREAFAEVDGLLAEAATIPARMNQLHAAIQPTLDATAAVKATLAIPLAELVNRYRSELTAPHKDKLDALSGRAAVLRGEILRLENLLASTDLPEEDRPVLQARMENAESELLQVAGEESAIREDIEAKVALKTAELAEQRRLSEAELARLRAELAAPVRELRALRERQWENEAELSIRRKELVHPYALRMNEPAKVTQLHRTLSSLNWVNRAVDAGVSDAETALAPFRPLPDGLYELSSMTYANGTETVLRHLATGAKVNSIPVATPFAWVEIETRTDSACTDLEFMFGRELSWAFHGIDALIGAQGILAAQTYPDGNGGQVQGDGQSRIFRALVRPKVRPDGQREIFFRPDEAWSNSRNYACYASVRVIEIEPRP